MTARREGAVAVAAAAMLLAFAALLAWNSQQYAWLRGFDAEAMSLYVDVVRDGRLPTQEETTVWHNPPLFFAVAAAVESLAERAGTPDDPRAAVQLVSVLFAFVVAVVTFLVARELFPRSAVAQLGALGFVVTMPVLVRAGVLYHPEALAAALVAGGTYLVVRSARRPSVLVALAAGALVGLANLTRTWALAAVPALALAYGARWLARRERTALLSGLAFAGVAAALVVPWLAYKAADHGSPLAYSKPNPQQWVLEGRPREFYTSFPVREVFGTPYAPHFLNRLLPVVYTDWWGDYWRYYDVPLELATEPPRLPDEYHHPRVLQSWAGVLPTLLILAGVAGLAVQAVRTRSAPLVALVLPLLALAASFTWFLTENPKLDGDNVKALYVLNGALPAAVAGGWALSQVARAGTLVLAAVLLLLAGVAYLDVFFLVLPAG
ncbi:MAG TPA: glycosyltransferase family 39 protein [Gaiellaceae bacterium]|nr:glycosyltransferase family 39 protein [Gaiellaceae bacterium]